MHTTTLGAQRNLHSRPTISSHSPATIRASPPFGGPAGGGVTVSAAFDAPKRRVAVTVTDTGAGIAPDALPHVFDRFYKSAESRGSGLGLAIARDLVRAHGGGIVAESDGAGRGTTIRFELLLEAI